jgi:hypothetical protein
LCVLPGYRLSRRIEQARYEDLSFPELTAKQQPDRSRMSEFRRRNLDAPCQLFAQNLRLRQEDGMVSLGHVALDGTQEQANASKHKAMSPQRRIRIGRLLMAGPRSWASPGLTRSERGWPYGPRRAELICGGIR